MLAFMTQTPNCRSIFSAGAVLVSLCFKNVCPYLLKRDIRFLIFKYFFFVIERDNFFLHNIMFIKHINYKVDLFYSMRH